MQLSASTFKERFFMDQTTVYNIAFFDAEFTADNAKDRGVQEMIQCAFIVHQIVVSDDKKLLSISDSPLYEYTTYTKPSYHKELSEYIKELTGIEQKDVDAGKSFCDTMSDIYNAVQQYQVKRIIVWGPDRPMLKYNCDISGYSRTKSAKVFNKFHDVSQKLSDFFGYELTLSQHRMCELLHITEFGNRHNAYYDALNLKQIINEFCGQIRL